MLSAREMKRLCETLDAAQREYLMRAYHEDVDNSKVYRRYRPATAAEIARLEKEHGMKCPPSYRNFLKIQNGWRQFALGWSLLGAERAENRDLHETVRQTLGHSGAVATEEELEELIAKEKKDPTIINPRHHWIIGSDANFNLLVLDRHRISKDGEPQVVCTRYIIYVSWRRKDFEEFLRDMLDRVEKRLVDLRELANKNRAGKTSGRGSAATKMTVGKCKAAGSSQESSKPGGTVARSQKRCLA